MLLFRLGPLAGFSPDTNHVLHGINYSRAGLCLCESVYYCSPAQRQPRKATFISAPRMTFPMPRIITRVTFLHVPPVGESHSLEDMKLSFEEIIKFICWRNGSVHVD
ncbi:uncharacterized protein EI90DRAFT_2692041 [Cantharellus anzutake]|uniref:uncharacterized protein n=1 Tax=Cantharellus anzutake TaxID=1750568 RepID=UPI00190406D0|nr:uncharacterized protein EI90DRAFT_2692041 [Cantharellus anzutake]KAF8318932.1 hypothetical protein EI90DRAFT_2692041 [Cantharellus anzutake]